MQAREDTASPYLGEEELKPYYQIKPLKLKNTLLFHATLTYNKLQMAWNECDQIGEHLFLGRIPEKKLQVSSTVRLIVSVITYGELAEADFPFGEIDTKGIRHVLLPVADFDSHFSVKALVNIVGLIDEYVSSGGGVFLHCKAGRSRSGMVAACYLAYKHGISLPEAIDQISEAREQVSIGSAKRAKAEEALGILEEQGRAKDSVSFKDKAGYLSSLRAKNEICQLPSFKKLAIYLVNQTEKSTSAKYLRAFLDEIRCSHDGSWYDNWQNPETNLGNFLRCDRIYSEKNRLRYDLVFMFERELRSLISRRVSKQPAVKLK